jgi:hypothetical protein
MTQCPFGDKNKRKPLPFSIEAFGKEVFYGKSNASKNDIFDW